MKIVNKSVTDIEVKKIEKLTRECMRHLKKRVYELDLPNGCIDEAVKRLEIGKRANGRSRAGKNRIYINLSSWQNGNSFYKEYDSFNDHPTIGRIAVSDNDDILMLIVAHEVSHFVQYRYAPRINRFKNTWDKPHGDCFKAIYDYLRRDLVNPRICSRLSQPA